MKSGEGLEDDCSLGTIIPGYVLGFTVLLAGSVLQPFIQPTRYNTVYNNVTYGTLPYIISQL